MPRKGYVPRREVPGDPKFDNVLVTRFISAIMGRGKRSLAERQFYGAMTMVEEKTGRAYYLERIELTEDPGVVQKGAEVVPGMQADAIILTGESTLFGYLKRPIERTFERALRED